MVKEENSVPFEQILDDTNQLIQISDEETYSMIYANMTARKFTDHANQEYKGQHCYQYMMGLQEQCPFCPMRQMEDKDSFVTEIDNGQQVFTVKTKRIIWEGTPCFIEYATDITTTKRAQKIFESQMQTLIQSIPEAQGIFHVDLTNDSVISTNGISKNIDRFRDSTNVNMLILDISSFIPDEDEQGDFLKIFQRDALMIAYQKGKTEIVKELKSYYDDGSIRWARITARLIENPNTGDLEAIIYGMDINDEKQYLEKMKKAENEKEAAIEKSRRDMLTGVYSKKAFEKIAIEYIQACPNQPFGIVFMDLDNFKAVNDTLGHLVGDKVIIETADKLETIFSNKDIISRFGGDEFCILVKNISKEKLIDKLNFMLKKLTETYTDDKNSVSVTASIGVSYCEGGVDDILPLIQKADVALYQAKRNGRNQYQMD